MKKIKLDFIFKKVYYLSMFAILSTLIGSTDRFFFKLIYSILLVTSRNYFFKKFTDK